jgi:hypothetical protein
VKTIVYDSRSQGPISIRWEEEYTPLLEAIGMIGEEALAMWDYTVARRLTDTQDWKAYVGLWKDGEGCFFTASQIGRYIWADGAWWVETPYIHDSERIPIEVIR